MADENPARTIMDHKGEGIAPSQCRSNRYRSGPRERSALVLKGIHVVLDLAGADLGGGFIFILSWEIGSGTTGAENHRRHAERRCGHFNHHKLVGSLRKAHE